MQNKIAEGFELKEACHFKFAQKTSTIVHLIRFTKEKKAVTSSSSNCLMMVEALVQCVYL